MSQDALRRHSLLVSLGLLIACIGFSGVDIRTSVDHEQTKEMARRVFAIGSLFESSLPPPAIARASDYFNKNNDAKHFLAMRDTAPSNPSGIEATLTSAAVSSPKAGTNFVLSVLRNSDDAASRSCDMLFQWWSLGFGCFAVVLYLAVLQLANASGQRMGLAIALLVVAHLLPIIVLGLGSLHLASINSMCFAYGRAGMMGESLRVYSMAAEGAVAGGADPPTCRALLESTSFQSTTTLSVQSTPTGIPNGEVRVDFSASDPTASASIYSVALGATLTYTSVMDETLDPTFNLALAATLAAVGIVTVLGLAFAPYGSLSAGDPTEAHLSLSPYAGFVKVLQLGCIVFFCIGACSILTYASRIQADRVDDMQVRYANLNVRQSHLLSVARKRLAVATALALGSDWAADAVDYTGIPYVDATAVASLASYFDEVKTIRSRIETDGLSLRGLYLAATSPPTLAGLLQQQAIASNTSDAMLDVKAALAEHEAVFLSFLYHTNVTRFREETATTLSSINAFVAELGVAARQSTVLAAVTTFDAAVAAYGTVGDTIAAQTQSFDDVFALVATAQGVANRQVEQAITTNASIGVTTLRNDAIQSRLSQSTVEQGEFIIEEATTLLFCAVCVAVALLLVEFQATFVKFGVPDMAPARHIRRAEFQHRVAVSSASRYFIIVAALLIIAGAITRQQALADHPRGNQEYIDTEMTLASRSDVYDSSAALVSSVADIIYNYVYNDFVVPTPLAAARTMVSNIEQLRLSGFVDVTVAASLNEALSALSEYGSLANQMTARRGLGVCDRTSVQTTAIELQSATDALTQLGLANGGAYAPNCSALVNYTLSDATGKILSALSKANATQADGYRAAKELAASSSISTTATLAACGVNGTAVSTYLDLTQKIIAGSAGQSKCPSLVEANNLFGAVDSFSAVQLSQATANAIQALQLSEKDPRNGLLAVFWVPVLFTWVVTIAVHLIGTWTTKAKGVSEYAVRHPGKSVLEEVDYDQ